jgi:hypothetical protein
VKAELLVKATLAKNGLVGVVRDLVLGQTRNERLREITLYNLQSQ